MNFTMAMLWCHYTGSMWSDGRISIGQCDLVESWDNLSLSQKKNLNYRYQMGCECRVSKDCLFSIQTYLSLSHWCICLRGASRNKADIAKRLKSSFHFSTKDLRWFVKVLLSSYFLINTQHQVYAETLQFSSNSHPNKAPVHNTAGGQLQEQIIRWASMQTN